MRDGPASPGGVHYLNLQGTTRVEHGLAGHASSVELSFAPAGRSKVADAARAREETEAGKELIRRGQYREALERFNAALRILPGEAEFHYNVACAAWRAERLNHVEPHLLEAARLQPQNPAAHEALALWFLRSDRLEQAREHSAAALAIRPNHPDYVITHADVLRADGQELAAWDLIEPLVARETGGPWLARIYARIAPTVAREAHAVEFLERSLQTPGLTPQERSPIHFAAVRLLDKMGRFSDAFRHATLANEASRKPFDAAFQSRIVAERIRYYTKKRLKSLPRTTHGNRRPVLIVGMPRSGTSLVEQILASHPDVRGAGELSKLSEIVVAAAASPWAEGRGFPDCFDFMSMRRADEMAADYLATIDSHDTTATYVTDKMPYNFLFLGTAELLMPGCQVIHCVRNARDTCLSCYMTDFTGRERFGYDLGQIAGAYRDYRRLMDHWKKVLTLPILDVRYEDVVADQRGQTRRILEFLNLPWDERVMNFHETRRPVATASREQVRRPIYASSVGRWKHYEPHVTPLMGL